MINMIRRFVFGLVVCAAPALWAGDKAAEAYLQSLGDQVVAIVMDDSLTGPETHESVRALLESNFAVEDMARFALGKYWRRASQDEKNEFLELFRLLVVHNYTNRFETHTDEKFKVTDSRVEKDGAIVVSSELIRPSGPPLPLDWRLYKKGNGYRVYDVIVDGISMSITLRSEYASVIQREGGRISDLNKAMRAKWMARSD